MLDGEMGMPRAVMHGEARGAWRAAMQGDSLREGQTDPSRSPRERHGLCEMREGAPKWTPPSSSDCRSAASEPADGIHSEIPRACASGGRSAGRLDARGVAAGGIYLVVDAWLRRGGGESCRRRQRRAAAAGGRPSWNLCFWRVECWRPATEQLPERRRANGPLRATEPPQGPHRTSEPPQGPHGATEPPQGSHGATEPSQGSRRAAPLRLRMCPLATNASGAASRLGGVQGRGREAQHRRDS
ncbi:hypothetical protein AB1Y20_019490 [Prymnesium parvum]|uniref:Uncharacterized protein n=1 Tax=Prymnesium parvum TaxID=97485 RepID=A0AB34JRA5_PRYPA